MELLKGINNVFRLKDMVTDKSKYGDSYLSVQVRKMNQELRQAKKFIDDTFVDRKNIVNAGLHIRKALEIGCESILLNKSSSDNPLGEGHISLQSMIKKIKNEEYIEDKEFISELQVTKNGLNHCAHSDDKKINEAQINFYYDVAKRLKDEAKNNIKDYVTKATCDI